MRTVCIIGTVPYTYFRTVYTYNRKGNAVFENEQFDPPEIITVRIIESGPFSAGQYF